MAKIIGAHSLQREWVMPDLTRYRQQEEMEVAKTERPTLEVENPDLPVEADVDGSTMKFPNAQAFIDWFDPKRHVLEGSITDEKGTQVKVRDKKPVPRAPKTSSRGAVAKKEAAERTAAGRELKEAAAKVAKKGDRALASAQRKARVEAEKGRHARVPGSSKPRGHNFVRHGVRVGGKEYRSAWDAFQQLNLGNAGECVKFRNVLKEKGKATFEKGNKKYHFETFVKE